MDRVGPSGGKNEVKELRKQGLDDAAAISNDSENGKAACISCDYYLVGIDEVQTDVSRQGKKG